MHHSVGQGTVVKLAEAADIFLAVQPKLDELAEELKQLEEAKKVLKKHFTETGNTNYARRVGAKLGSRNIFDQAMAKEQLGAAKAEACYKPVTTVTLFPI